MFLNFKEFALSRDEQQKIKGGEITCSITFNYDDPDGSHQTLQSFGSCAGNSVGNCTNNAMSACYQMAYYGGLDGGGCSATCREMAP